MLTYTPVHTDCFLHSRFSPVTPGLSFNSHCSGTSKSRLTFEFPLFEVFAPIL